MKSIGNILIELRGDKTLEEVANACGVTAQAIWNYEHDVRVPRDNIKKILADYYKLKVQDIFFAEKVNIKLTNNNKERR